MKMIAAKGIWLLAAASVVCGQMAVDMDSHNFDTSSSTTSTTTTEDGGTTTITTTTTTTLTRTLLWSDEFNDSGNRPDDNIWSYDTGPWSMLANGGLQTYTSSPANSALENGFLKIIARQENQGFTSAALKTEDKLRFRYGTVEIRAQWPNLNAGLWPSFWTLGADFMTQGWPRAGEIDIMAGGQGLGLQEGKANKRVVSAAHWGGNDGSYATSSQARDFAEDLSQGFHNYRLEWTPQVLQTFVDDQLVWEMSIDRSMVDNVEGFHDYHFLMMSLAVGGGFTSASSGQVCGSSSPFSSVSPDTCPLRGVEEVTAPIPGVMQVDYIRLYNNGFSEVIFGSGSVLVAQNGASSVTSGSTFTNTNTNTNTNTAPEQGPCYRDMDCNFATQWCDLDSATCFDKRVGGNSCIRDRVCWSNDCRGSSRTCRGGEAPTGFSSTTVTNGSNSLTTTTAVYLLPASDVRCERDMDCNFDTEWCDLDTSTCFFKRPGGTSCFRDRVCWSETCTNDFCRGGSAPAGFTYTSTSIYVISAGGSTGTTGTSNTVTSGSTNGNMNGGSTGSTTNVNMNGGSTESTTNVNMNGGSPESTTNVNMNGGSTTIVAATPQPTPVPTNNPTPFPTNRPTLPPVTPGPTNNPTPFPTNRPTQQPTPGPTNNPTPFPTDRPTQPPVTPGPTNNPTPLPTNMPTPPPTTPEFVVASLPVTPAPVTPLTPAPVTPAPVAPLTPVPVPVTPAPVTPAPVTPEVVVVALVPVTPAPVTPLTPAPVTPAPVAPLTPVPVPVTPAPVTPEVVVVALPATPAPVTPLTAAPITAAPVTAAPVTAAPVTAAPVTPLTPATVAPVAVIASAGTQAPQPGATPASNSNGATANVVSVNGVSTTTGTTTGNQQGVAGGDVDCFEQVSVAGGGKGKGGKAGKAGGLGRGRRTRENNTRRRGHRGRKLQTGCVEIGRSGSEEVTSRASSRAAGSEENSQEVHTDHVEAAKLEANSSAVWAGPSTTMIISALVAGCAVLMVM